jgi:hypothetical protein
VITVGNGMPHERLLQVATTIGIHVPYILSLLHLRIREHGLQVLHLLHTQSVVLAVGEVHIRAVLHCGKAIHRRDVIPVLHWNGKMLVLG